MNSKDYILGYEDGKRDGYTQGFLAGEKSNNIEYWKNSAKATLKVIWAIAKQHGEIRITKLSLMTQDDKSKIVEHEDSKTGDIIIKAI